MKNPHFGRRSITVLLLSTPVLLPACVSPRTHVLEAARPVAHDRMVRITRGESTAQVDGALQDAFEASLAEQLKSKAMFTTVSMDQAAFTIEYRFVLQDAGSKGVRVGAGIASLAGSPFYGLGDGAVGVEVVYRGRDGSSVGHTVTDAPISGPFATVKGGVQDAAGTIAEYTGKHYAEMAQPALAAKQ